MKRALTTGKGNLGFVEEKRREKRDKTLGRRGKVKREVGVVPTSLPSLSYPSPNPKLPSVGLTTDISVELVVLINSFMNFLFASIQKKWSRFAPMHVHFPGTCISCSALMKRVRDGID